MIYRMLYVCMYVFMHVFACFLTKGPASFDPNNAKFTQKMDECLGLVMLYIPQKTVQNWLKNQFIEKGSVHFKSWERARLALVEMRYEFPSSLGDLRIARVTLIIIIIATKMTTIIIITMIIIITTTIIITIIIIIIIIIIINK